MKVICSDWLKLAKVCVRLPKCVDCGRELKPGFTSRQGKVGRRSICKWCHNKRWNAFIGSIDPDDEP